MMLLLMLPLAGSTTMDTSTSSRRRGMMSRAWFDR
jgi:hypothetical protein